MKNARAGLIVMAFCTLASTISHAQDFPRRAITLILPFSAGGVTDQVARLVAGKVADNIGNPVVVENRPGGGGQIAAGAVKASPAGRLHASGRRYRHSRDQRVALQQAVLRSVERLRARGRTGRDAARSCRPERQPVQDDGRSHRRGEDKPRSPDLRVGGGRQRRSPSRRNAQVPTRSRSRPCSLSRYVADSARPNVDPGQAVFRRGRKHDAAHPGRKTCAP